MEAEFYTCNPTFQKQLLALCGKYPGEIRKTSENGYGGVTFVLPKRWLRVVPPRILTPAQRAVVDRMNAKKHRETR